MSVTGFLRGVVAGIQGGTMDSSLRGRVLGTAGGAAAPGTASDPRGPACDCLLAVPGISGL